MRESFLKNLQLSLRLSAQTILLFLTICTGMSSAQADAPYSAVEVLSRADADLYLKIFKVQKKGYEKFQKFQNCQKCQKGPSGRDGQENTSTERNAPA